MADEMSSRAACSTGMAESWSHRCRRRRGLRHHAWPGCRLCMRLLRRRADRTLSGSLHAQPWVIAVCLSEATLTPSGCHVFNAPILLDINASETEALPVLSSMKRMPQSGDRSKHDSVTAAIACLRRRQLRGAHSPRKGARVPGESAVAGCDLDIAGRCRAGPSESG